MLSPLPCIRAVEALAALLSTATPSPQLPRLVEHQRAVAVVDQCLHDVPYLVAYGRALLRVGDAQQAAAILERALLLEPANDLAKQSYAMALHALGDWDAAAELAKQLRTPPPQALGGPLPLSPTPRGQRRDQPWETLSTLSVAIGGETNPRAVANLSALTLTLPGLLEGAPVRVTLPVADTYAPQPSGYGQWGLSWSAAHLPARSSSVTEHEGLITGTFVRLSVRQRHIARLQEAGYLAADGFLERAWARQFPRPGTGPRHFLTGIGVYAQTTAQILKSRGIGQFSQLGVALGLSLQADPCQFRWGAEHSGKSLSSSPQLAGTINLWVASVQCAGQWSVQIRTGVDRASSTERPGGDQSLSDLRAHWQLGRWALMTDALSSRDASGYSAFIDEGARRLQRRYQFRAEYRQPTSYGEWVIGAERTVQHSNIPLFPFQNLGLHIGWRLLR